MARLQAATGQQVIAVYKLAKGLAEIVLALALAVFVATGAADATLLAVTLRRHFSEIWSVKLAALFTVRHIELTGVALLLDGLFALFEGWVLRRSRWWAPWLVAIGTALIVPFEVLALVSHLRWSRVLALVVNVGIVVYLARKAVLDQRAATSRE